jgi:hypothetical protein
LGLDPMSMKDHVLSEGAALDIRFGRTELFNIAVDNSVRPNKCNKFSNYESIELNYLRTLKCS